MNRPILVAGSVVFLGALLVLVYRFGGDVWNDPALHHSIKYNPVRESLLKKSSASEIMPTDHPAGFDPYILDVDAHDVSDMELAREFRSTLFGERTLRVLVSITSQDRAALHVRLQDYSGVTINIRDDINRWIGGCRGSECKKPVHFVKTDSQLVLLKYEGKSVVDGDSIRLKLNRKHAAKPIKPLVHFDLELDAMGLTQLDNLMKTAKRVVRKKKLFQKKIRAKLTSGNDTSEVLINLTGHGELHHVDQPSISVSVVSGPAIFGAHKFKFYRWNLRGVNEAVISSLVQDAGILAPFRRPVTLSYNGRQKHLFFMEQRSSPAYFENMGELDSPVFKFDSELSMIDRELKTVLGYSPHRYDKKLNLKQVDLVSMKAASTIDTDSFSKYFALTTLLGACHGYQLDDLDLLRNPLDGKFHPISNDMSAFACPHFAGLSTWSLSRAVTTALSLRFITFKPSNPGYEANYQISAFLWDHHPAVIRLMRDPLVHHLSDKRILEALDYQMEAKFQSRAARLSELLIKYNTLDAVALDELKEKTHKIEHRETPSYFSDLEKRPLRLQRIKEDTIRIINTLPVSVQIESTHVRNRPYKLSCFSTNKKWLMSPLWGHQKNGEPTDQLHLLLTKIYRHSPGMETPKWLPYCDITATHGTIPSSIISSLKFTLPNGRVLASQWVTKKSPTSDKTTSKGNKRAAFVPFDVVETPDRLVLGYVLHRTEGVSEPDFKAVRFRDDRNNQWVVPERVDIQYFKSLNLSERSDLLYRLPIAAEQLMQTTHDYFDKNTVLVRYQIKKDVSDKVIRLPTLELYKSTDYSQQGVTMFLYEDTQNLLTAREASIAASTPRVPSYVKLIGVRNGLKYFEVSSKKPLEVLEPWTIPKQAVVNIKAGVELKMGEDAFIKVLGQLSFEGTAQNPIRIAPIKDSWGGMSYVDSPQPNKVRHTVIEGARSFRDGPITAAGSLSIVRSRVEFSHCRFSNLTGSDGINFYHSSFIFEDSEMSDIAGDGIDSDFSIGTIRNSHFSRIEGDSIDLNQSRTEIQGNQIQLTKDKAISVGEKSVAFIMRNSIHDNRWGVGVKDSALVELKWNTFERNEIGVASFIKKPWYGFPEVQRMGNTFEGNKQSRADLGFYRY